MVDTWFAMVFECSAHWCGVGGSEAVSMTLEVAAKADEPTVAVATSAAIFALRTARRRQLRLLQTVRGAILSEQACGPGSDVKSVNAHVKEV